MCDDTVHFIETAPDFEWTGANFVVTFTTRLGRKHVFAFTPSALFAGDRAAKRAIEQMQRHHAALSPLARDG